MAEEQKTTENTSEKSKELSLIQQDKLVNAVLSDYHVSDGSRSLWLQQARRGLNLYFGLKVSKDFPFVNCANIHVPLIKTIQSTLESNVLGSLNYEKPVSVLPVGPEDFDRAKAVERLLNWQLTSQVDYREFMDKLIHSTLLYGHTFVKVRYVVEKEGRKKTFDGIKLDIPNPENVLFPPDTSLEDIDGWDYIIHELFLSLSDLKRRANAGFYKNVDKVQAGLGGAPIGGNSTKTALDLEEVRAIHTGIDSANPNVLRSPYPRILEWYGYYDIDEDGIEESLMVTIAADTKTLLRCVRWEGKRPFILVRFSPILNKVTGESVPSILAEINEELNTLHNQRVDAVTVSNIPFFFFDPMAGFDPNRVQLVPGLGIPVNGSPSQSVYFPTMSTVRPEMYREEEMLSLYAERLLGASANTQGVIQPQRTSATEIASIDKRAGIRFLNILNRIKTGLRRMFSLILELDQDKLPNEVKIRIVGFDVDVNFQTILKQDIQGSFDVSINGSSIVDEEAERTNQFQVYQMSLSNPLIMRNEIALYEVTKDTFSKLGVKRIDAYIRKPEGGASRPPSEEHNLLAQGERVRPNLGDNHEFHIAQHEEFIISEAFKLLPKVSQEATFEHLIDTKRMYEAIRKMQILNQMQAINTQMMQLQMGTHPLQTGPQGEENGSKTRGRTAGKEVARPGLGQGQVPPPA